mgnify:CR=1 FL=1
MIAIILLATEAADKTMREIRDLVYVEDAAHHEDDAQADDARNHKCDEATENVRDVDDACDAPGCELGNNAANEGCDGDLEAGNYELAKAEAAPAFDQDDKKHNKHEAVEDDVAACDAHESERAKARYGDDAGEEHVE